MIVKFDGGKKSKNNFIGGGFVVFPGTLIEDAAWGFTTPKCQYDEIISFGKHENSLRACLRKIRKRNYPHGTRICLQNWYVGYSDVFVYI